MIYGSLCQRRLGKTIHWSVLLMLIRQPFSQLSVFDFLSLLKGLKTDDSQLAPILGSNTLTVSS